MILLEFEKRNWLLVDRDYCRMIRIFDEVINGNVDLEDRQNQEMELKERKEKFYY